MTTANYGLIYKDEIGAIATFGDTVFAADHRHGVVYRSTNSGREWEPINEGLKGTNVNAFIQIGDNVLAGTAIGIFQNTFNGIKWAPLRDTHTIMGVMSLIKNDTYLIAGTSGSGIWYRPLSELATVPVKNTNLQPKSSSRSDFALHSPIHHGPNSSITFSLPHSSTVTIKVFNMSGHQIATILDCKELIAGSHTLPWNTGSLAPGFYAVQLWGGNRTETKNIIIAR